MARSRLSTRIIILSVGLAAGTGLMECALRLAGLSYPWLYQLDDLSGYSLRPGAVGTVRYENDVTIRINSDGLRDREHSIEKPAATLRVAVLGDSYAEAFQVDLDHTFWAVAEKRLADCPSIGGRKTEFINFGVAGYGTADELLVLRHRVWKYDPDIVLLVMTMGNDMADNWNEEHRNPERPYFRPGNSGLILDDTFRSRPGYRLRRGLVATAYFWARDRSYLIQLIAEHKHLLLRRRAGAPRDAANRKPWDPEPGIDDHVFLPVSDGVWSHRWSITEELLKKIREEVDEHRVRMLLVTTSAPIQVHPDPEVRRKFMERIGASTLLHPDERIREIAARLGVPSLLLAPLLQREAEARNIVLHGLKDPAHGHWNAEGHALAGRFIAQSLCEEILADPSPKAAAAKS